MAIHVGVDVGGTFTDVVLYDDQTGDVRVAKVPSTRDDHSQGLLDGLDALPVDPADIDLLVHGTTVATNAVLERSGARCGLLMTKGFRDVIELRRRDRPDTYGLKGRFEPLITRDRRLEVTERTDYRGEVLARPDRGEVLRAVEELLANDVEAIIISFLHSYANPSNERRVKELVEEVWPNPYVVASSEILPEIREFERTSTAVLSGYVQPLVDRYLRSLTEKLRARGYGRDVLIVQSNGGLMSQRLARRYSVNTILSGPAAGVIAARQVGLSTGDENLITCDVGGTSLDIAVAARGGVATAQDMDLEYGLPIRTTMLDVRSVGAGGGSIAWIDRAGILQIGPHSAGADPGPVCYGQGGTRPTVTDANVVLGRIGPERPIGREAGWVFEKGGAETAIRETIAEPLGLSTMEAAWAILQVAHDRIAASLRLMTVERGHDPRDFALVAYGGAGPLHACAVLRELEISKALIPPWPGITSALGCITAEIRHDFARSLNVRLDELDAARFYSDLERQVVEGRELIEREGVNVASVDVAYQADMAYEGQVHEVRAPLPARRCDRDGIREAFERAYSAQYGNKISGRPVRIVTTRVSVIGVRRRSAEWNGFGSEAAPLDQASIGRRPVYFDNGFVECPVYERGLLGAGVRIDGPAVIEQPDSTTVVEPGTSAVVGPGGTLIVRVAA